jgi:hypothetical protein
LGRDYYEHGATPGRGHRNGSRAGHLLDLCAQLAPQVPDLDQPALARINEALPPYSPRLLELSLAVAEQRLVSARENAKDASEFRSWTPNGMLSHLAGCLNDFGVRLSQAKRREEALKTTQEAVEMAKS